VPGPYEAVHVHPDGPSTVRRVARQARTLGYEGVVVRNHGDARADANLDAVADDIGIDVVDGIEIRADSPEQASGYVGNYRPKHTVLFVHGGSNAMNRFAVESERVDVLAHPTRDDGDVNHVLAKAAARNGVRLEFDFARVLRSSGGQRVKAISGLRKLRELVEQYDVPFVVSADPGDHRELRGPRALATVGERIGFSGDQIENGLAEWGRLAERNREVMSPEYLEPGVRRGRYRDGDGSGGDEDATGNDDEVDSSERVDSTSNGDGDADGA
jgi:ribonuclease P/MRP protein subunit RPP1